MPKTRNKKTPPKKCPRCKVVLSVHYSERQEDKRVYKCPKCSLIVDVRPIEWDSIFNDFI